jgi:hypothetical protein
MAKKKNKKKATKKKATKKKVAGIDPAVRKEWLEKVKEDGWELEQAPKSLRSDPEIVLVAVKQNGRALEYASKELRNDPKIVRAAVKQNGDALEHASKELRNNPQIVLAVVKCNAYALIYASKSMKSDSKIVLAAVKQEGRALEYASKELRNDPKIVLAAVMQSGFALRYSSKDLRNDPKIVLAAVKRNGHALEYASKELRNDPKIVLAAVKRNGHALEYASKELCNDPKIVLAAVEYTGSAIEYASEKMKDALKEDESSDTETIDADVPCTALFDTSDMNLATLVVKKSEINTVEKLELILTKFLEVDFEGERCEYPVFDDYLSFETDEGNTIAWKEKFEGHFDSPNSEEEITLFAYYEYAHASYQLCDVNPSSELTITTQEVDGVKIMTGIHQDDGAPYYDCVDSSGYNETLIGFISSDGSAFSVSAAGYEDLDLSDYPKMASRISGDILDLMNKQTA